MKIVSVSLKVIFYITLPVLFLSCATTGLPKANERLAIQNGKQILVLLRITCELEDATSVEAFKSIFVADDINIGLGSSFLVGGKVNRVIPRFLSPETRKQGWIYLILESGIHYFAFQGPQITDRFGYEKQLRFAPRFRVNIPKNNSLVYIGTLHLHCHSRRYLFGGKSCDFFDKRRMVVQNEESLAKKVETEYFSDFGSGQTLLMQRVY
jgi:hypothetical protein